MPDLRHGWDTDSLRGWYWDLESGCDPWNRFPRRRDCMCRDKSETIPDAVFIRSKQILLSSGIYSFTPDLCWCYPRLYRPWKRALLVSHVQIALRPNSRGVLREGPAHHSKPRHEGHGHRRQLSLFLRLSNRQRHPNHPLLPWTQRRRNASPHLLPKLPRYVRRRPWTEPRSIRAVQTVGAGSVRIAERYIWISRLWWGESAIHRRHASATRLVQLSTPVGSRGAGRGVWRVLMNYTISANMWVNKKYS